jgi:hypothetical protein
MELKVLRLGDTVDATIGALYIDGLFQCFTVEDEQRTVKVKGETRIPEGSYLVKLRKEGGFHAKYLEKFGAEFHKGMLHVTNVPNFEYILIHIGNTDEHTDGCLLVGLTATTDTVGNSVDAYKKIYPKIAAALLAKEQVHIIYQDVETGK